MIYPLVRRRGIDPAVVVPIGIKAEACPTTLAASPA
jgi:hypothetical protein